MRTKDCKKEKKIIASLLSPLTLRGVVLDNRVVMSPMSRYFSPGGVPGEDMAGYYSRRAEAGVGLIVTEGIGIDHPAAVDHPGVPHLHGATALAMWGRIVAAVHAAGARIFPQLWHQGAMWNVEYAGTANGQMPMRPSGLWGPADGIISIPEEARAGSLPPTRPMSVSDIQDVIHAYGAAARNAKALGFDGIAIHAAHGYLIDSFFWAHTNRRTDQWGGGRRERAGFGAAVVREIRREVGEAMPIALRFSQFKMQDYRARLADTPDELSELLGPLADAGVDLFDGSQRFFDTPAFAGSDLNLAGWAKKLTGKASMTVGGIGLDKGGGTARHIDDSQQAANNLPRVIERFERGEFDLIAVGRSLLNDASWLAKAKAGAPFNPFNPENLTRLT